MGELSAEIKDRANRNRDGSILGNSRPAGRGGATFNQRTGECLPGLWPRIPASSDDVHFGHDWWKILESDLSQSLSIEEL